MQQMYLKAQRGAGFQERGNDREVGGRGARPRGGPPGGRGAGGALWLLTAVLRLEPHQ